VGATREIDNRLCLFREQQHPREDARIPEQRFRLFHICFVRSARLISCFIPQAAGTLLSTAYH
jgi:hypothetical protein